MCSNEILGEHQASETIRHPRLRFVKNEDKLLSLALRSLGSACLVPRRLSFDENVRAKEGGKETTGETAGRSCFQDGGESNGGPICNF